MTGSTEATVRKFIADNFMYREGIATLGDDESLLEKGLIDSTGVLELVAFVEKAFSLRVADEEVLPDNLDSVNRIVQFIERKRSSGAKACVA